MDHHEQKIGDLLKSFTQNEKMKEKLLQKKLESCWKKLFGATIAEYTRGIKLKRNVLHLYLDSSALRNEMHLAREKVIAIVNGEFREEYIRDIVIHP